MHSQFAGKKLTKEQVVQYDEEKKRVKEIGRTDPNDVLGQLADHLGKFFDAVDQVEQLFYEEERKAKEVYKGNDSESRRALQRVLVRSRLDALQVELRETKSTKPLRNLEICGRDLKKCVHRLEQSKQPHGKRRKNERRLQSTKGTW